MYFLMGLSKPISFLIEGYSYRKEFALLGSKFFPSRVTPKLEVIQLVPFNREEILVFVFQRVWKFVKCQGKVREF